MGAKSEAKAKKKGRKGGKRMGNKEKEGRTEKKGREGRKGRWRRQGRGAIRCREGTMRYKAPKDIDLVEAYYKKSKYWRKRLLKGRNPRGTRHSIPKGGNDA